MFWQPDAADLALKHVDVCGERVDEPLQAATADEFAQQLLADQPDGIDSVIDLLVAKRTRRPITRTELVDQLAGGYTGFAAELRRTGPMIGPPAAETLDR